MSGLLYKHLSRRAGPRLCGTSVAVALWVACLAVLTHLPSALAQTQEPGANQPQQNVQVFKDWYLRCVTSDDGAEHCILLQDLVNQDNQEPLMQIAAGFWGPDRLRGLIITLPLGVTLPPGIRIMIDDQPVGRAPFFQCTLNGCQSRIPLEDEFLDKLKAGQKGTVTFRDAQGRDIPLAYSLRGFTAGFAAVK